MHPTNLPATDTLGLMVTLPLTLVKKISEKYNFIKKIINNKTLDTYSLIIYDNITNKSISINNAAKKSIDVLYMYFFLN